MRMAGEEAAQHRRHARHGEPGSGPEEHRAAFPSLVGEREAAAPGAGWAGLLLTAGSKKRPSSDHRRGPKSAQRDPRRHGGIELRFPGRLRVERLTYE